MFFALVSSAQEDGPEVVSAEILGQTNVDSRTPVRAPTYGGNASVQEGEQTDMQREVKSLRYYKPTDCCCCCYFR